MIGCSSVNKYYQNDELIIYDIKDDFLLRSISLYKKEQLSEFKNSEIRGYRKNMIIILSKDLNDPNEKKYINHIFNDSHIYNEPISGFFINEKDTILVYSKKDCFINPWKYTAEFSSKMKVQLNDNESKYQQEDGSFLDFKNPYISNHSLYWKVEKNKLYKRTDGFDPFKFLYGNKNESGYDYDGKGDSLSLKIAKFN
ncbi:hypothetical protein [Dokdonia donghaensis]|uniref:Uncharacterized protein n=2 Tax=Dokdonia TaxID=326319 RepID=A0A0A2GZ82_9FLAO|nr:hypothetical protein [Dokdonia donghaensis]ANH61030.1 hypothetical protein I597_2132 [Dokdonia donghaensis DSW-1]KGO05740.1 hypothetical protein NV36_02005 [Dokdonia donghaensis DSW-1]